jgi:hypothetical protein
MVFGTRVLTRSTRVTFFMGVVKCKVYEFPEGYKMAFLLLESAKISRVDSI